MTPPSPQIASSIALVSDSTPSQHSFYAASFVENLSLKDLSPAYPESKRTPHELRFACERGGHVFIYPFGVVVFFDVPKLAREAELSLLSRARPGLTPALVDEEFSARAWTRAPCRPWPTACSRSTR